jgi:HEAT repeat protein
MMAISIEKIKKWEKKGKVEKLIKALEVDVDRVRRWAIKALGEIGDAKAADALVTLVRALGNDGLFLKENAFEALVKIGLPAQLSRLSRPWRILIPSFAAWPPKLLQK